jgi:hypothetical protein
VAVGEAAEKQDEHLSRLISCQCVKWWDAYREQNRAQIPCAECKDLSSKLQRPSCRPGVYGAGTPAYTGLRLIRGLDAGGP